MSRMRLGLLVALALAACDTFRSELGNVSDAGGTTTIEVDARGQTAPDVDAAAGDPGIAPVVDGADAEGPPAAPRPDASAGLDASPSTDASSGPDASFGPDAGPAVQPTPDAGDAGSAPDAHSAPTEAGCPDCCPDGKPRGKAAEKHTLRRIAAFTPSPADVTTCPDGRVFLTLDGPDRVVHIPESGPPELYAEVTGVQPAGIACDARGRLYVIAFALRQGSRYSAPGVLLIEKALAAPRMLPPPNGGLATPNGIAAAHGLGVYVTDTLNGTVAFIREQNGEFVTTIVARNMLGVNGVAFDGAARKLYVSNSLFSDVTSFAVAADGALNAKKVEWTASGFPQLDGMIVDELGRPYVGAYGTGDVLRLPQATVVAQVANPASLAFRGGALLVVDYHLGEPAREGGLYTVELGACAAR